MVSLGHAGGRRLVELGDEPAGLVGGGVGHALQREVLVGVGHQVGILQVGTGLGSILDTVSKDKEDTASLVSVSGS